MKSMRNILPALLLLAGTSMAEDAISLKQVKALCRGYTEGFVSPATDLAYCKRINGPRGISVLASPAEIAQRRVSGEFRPWGYGSGIADTAYQNGMLIYALLDAETATRDSYFAGMAKRAFRGLQRMSRVSPVPGFIPRGPHPDGKSYYPDSSVDQHTLYMCGIWRYYHSRFATPEDKAWIQDMAGKFIGRIEKAKWSIQTEDGATAAHAGGSMLGKNAASSISLLSMLSIAHDLTGDAHWKAAYDSFSAENGGQRWALIEKGIDRSRPARHTLWFNQSILRAETLRRIEKDYARKAILSRYIQGAADEMLRCSYFEAWRREDWLEDETWAAAYEVDVANRYLAPLGLTVDSKATVLDLAQRFDVNRWSPETLRAARVKHFETPGMEIY